MLQTTNYQFNKPELNDSPDITQLNPNWDKIDTELKNLNDDKFDKSGGTISGEVTVNGTLTTNSLVNIGEYKLKVDITKGQTPIEAKYATIGIYDNSLSEGYRLGRIQYGISTNNTASMAMYVNRPNDAESEDSCGLLAQWLNGTTARISVTHHPETASNDKSVATTYWVRNLKATASQYGLVKLADETAILNESDESALTVDKAYELNDFRRMETAYSVGDKVNCAFNFGLFLECTTAGTTSADTLDTRNVTHGQVIMDGTCQWTVRSHVKSVNGNVPDANGNITVKSLSVTEIKANEDLNNFKEFGEYWCNTSQNAATVKNCPTDMAFTLTVRKSSSTQQELREYTGNAVYIRVYRSWEDTWSEWKKQGSVASVDGNTPDANGNVTCIYRSVESLGLSQNTNTIIDVYKALPNNQAIFFDYINGSNVESFGVPTNGILKILKDNGNGCAYLNKYAGTTEAWYANFASSDTIDTIKWQKIVTTESLRSDIKSAVLDIFFPVGSIYMDATGKINPNTQFGGTWQKIQNRFLYGSGEKSVGTTGGEQTHVLSVNEIPSHSHGWGTQNITGRTNFASGETGSEATSLRSSGTKGAFTVNTEVEQYYAKGETGGGLYKYLDFTGNKSWQGSTANTGGGNAHNNMPPYLVVTIWKRTA